MDFHSYFKTAWLLKSQGVCLGRTEWLHLYLLLLQPLFLKQSSSRKKNQSEPKKKKTMSKQSFFSLDANKNERIERNKKKFLNTHPKMPMCSYCGKVGLHKRCACTYACYCDKTCQNADWDDHKKLCLLLRKPKDIPVMQTRSYNFDVKDPRTIFFAGDLKWHGDFPLCPAMGINHFSKHHSVGESLYGKVGNITGIKNLRNGMATFIGITGFESASW